VHPRGTELLSLVLMIYSFHLMYIGAVTKVELLSSIRFLLTIE